MNFVKGLLIFLGGAAIGGGASYFITKSICEARSEKEISDRVESLVNEYKAHELSKLNNDIKENLKSVIIKDEPKEDRQMDIFEYSKKLKETGYSTYSHDIKTEAKVEEPKEAPDDDEVLERHNTFNDSKYINEDDILEEKEDEDGIDDNSGESGVSKAPYIISPEEFQNDHTEDYEKESLILFRDNILTDADFAEISAKDADILLGGPKLFMAFGSKGARKNIVFIRNDTLHVDYEICRSPRKYVEEVLHMEDEDDKE